MKNLFKLNIILISLFFVYCVSLVHTVTISKASINITASADDGNIPVNTVDNNLDTLWSAAGDGQWIEYDLGSENRVTQLLIAFYKGNTRTAQFDIQVSSDRSSWSPVFEGSSNGLTLEQEQFDIQETLARYIRIVGHGNSENHWISITEVDLIGPGGLLSGVFPTPTGFKLVSSSSPTSPPEETIPEQGETFDAAKIFQGSITWTFDSDYAVGQFANGDYYVFAPDGVTITNISPAWDGSRNGAMLNPYGDTQGYHASAYKYSASSNVADNIPLTLMPGDILVSTTGGGTNKSYVHEAAILTIVSSIPPSGSFRPGYSSNGSVVHNFSTLEDNYSYLKKLQPTASTPSLATIEDLFARPWIDHLPGWTCRYIHPSNNMPDYGEDMSTDIGIGALMLHLNFTNEEKKRLLINYVQLGIDLYSAAVKNNGWQADGGHSSGRKWPILFAGIMLSDTNMKTIGQKSGAYALEGTFGSPPADYIHFGEDDQTFYVTQDEINITNGSTWDPDIRSGPGYPYTSGMIGMPEWGIRHANSPENSDSAWYAQYRDCCTAIAWNGFVMAAHIMDAKTLWNHDALFDYQDRYMALTNGGSDPFGYSVTEESSGWRSSSDFTEEMWDTYRLNY